MNKEPYKLIIPNHIVVKNGLACGDKLTLMYDFDNGAMCFELIPEACIYCCKMCDYLQHNLNMHLPESIRKECENIETAINNNPQQICEALGLEYIPCRKDCMLSPVSILKECARDFLRLSGIENCPVDLNVSKMDCDACAVRENVSWLYEKPRHIHGNFSISEEKKEALMKLGKVSLSKFDKNEAKEVYESLTDDDFLFMEEYKLFPMVYQNFKDCGVLRKNDSRWRLLVYQRQRTAVAMKEIASVKKHISENGLKIYFVKGAYTHSLYKEPMMRNLTDFDLLALKSEDAFAMIEWLISEGFCIFPDSFSLKKCVSNGKNCYTGHLHLQKIINLQYRMIIDINFPGFPMVRIGSYIPEIKNGEITPESMIVITLCHLFKHKEIFVKDINDLYLMLTSSKVDFRKLCLKLEENGLEGLFAVLINHIMKEYNIADAPKEFRKLSERFGSELPSEYENWPYSEIAVKNVKVMEFEKFIGTREEFSRIYLYPLCIFKKTCNVSFADECIKKSFKDIESEYLTEIIIRYEIKNIKFVLTPAGWFLEMQEYYHEDMKKDIRYITCEMLKSTKLSCISIPYAVSFEEKWLDTEKE